MTQHPSLKSGSKGTKFRSVLKRFEKLKELVSKGKWDESKDSVYHLPKVRQIKFKIRKAAKEATSEGAVATGAGKPSAAGAAKPAAGAAKPAAGAAKPGASPAKGGAKSK
ncbi:hypothetical protein OMAG_002175 [Candidatus Omnitrophus magneticus]|uniref:Small basic protein n=1 Tax=Candidatus Omnitrophus magneticus TaxID=1609969 RepID=A0A0F0CL19_9BACT|nr:hypothetical protein OMAG_002175 [Candidatus Omnitrophus magneticus]